MRIIEIKGKNHLAMDFTRDNTVCGITTYTVHARTLFDFERNYKITCGECLSMIRAFKSVDNSLMNKPNMSELVANIGLLHNSGKSLAEIAEQLDKDGCTTKQGKTINKMFVSRKLKIYKQEQQQLLKKNGGGRKRVKK